MSGAWIIVGQSDTYSDEVVFWSNENGWGDLTDATRFTETERYAFNLPDGAVGWGEV